MGLLLNRGRGQVPEWFSFAQVYRLFYAPDAITARLQGSTPDKSAPGVEDLRRMLATAAPPSIDVLAVCWAGPAKEDCSPVAPSSTSRGIRKTAASDAELTLPQDVRAVTVRYRLGSNDTGRNVVDLFVNGRNAGRALVSEAGTRSGDLTQTVQVDPGLNQIQLRAYDDAGATYAQTRVIAIARAAAAPEAVAATKHRLFILAVGIDHYPPTINSLNFAVADARTVGRTIKAEAPQAYSETVLIELYDDSASATAVLAAIKKIAATAASDDTVLIYLSGHGDTVGKTYYFITQNVDSVASVPRAAISGAALVQALAAIQARNGFLFLDTCHAGAFSLDSASQIAHETGRYVLAASASVEEALDSYDNRNGVFATAVLRGLSGGGKGGAVVNNFDLGFFVTPMVHQLATERHHNQSARFKIATEDAQPFPIVQVPGAAPARP